MRRRFLSFLAIVMLTGTVSANPVDVNTARRVAETYLRGQGMTNPSALRNITAETPFTEFYVFAAPQGGFILVSGDDCVVPVLGYSVDNLFSKEDMPDHIRAVFDNYEREIRYWKQQEQSYGESVAHLQWQMLAMGEMPPMPLTTAVTPLLATTWNQSPYYNNLCPYDNNEGAYSVTGCVATATAQVMKYHNHPTTGYGSHTYTSTSVVGSTTYTYGPLTANFGATTYQWSTMPNALSSTSSTSQINAVATLMYHVGVADEMQYSPQGSGAHNYQTSGYVSASSQNSLVAYFKYRPDMAAIARDDYSDAEFCALLRAELDQSRPILYSGSNTTAGHSFVFDGYDNAGNIHVNWGWGGYHDGYFVMGSLNPGVGGIGGNSSGTYNLGNVALVGIRPNTNWNTAGTTTVTVASASGGSVTGAGNYAFGDTVTLFATASAGYRFNGWSDGCKFNPREFIATGGSYSFTPSFAPVSSGNTLSYCPGNFCVGRYGAAGGSNSYWGVKFPASVIPSGAQLSGVELYVGEAGTYNLTVYSGASRSTVLATASATFTSNDVDAWHTITLASAVTPTEDLWLTFTSPDAQYPVTYTYYSGAEGSACWGSTFYDVSTDWENTYMIRGLLTLSGGCDITQFPYLESFDNSLGCWTAIDANNDNSTWSAIASIAGTTDTIFPHSGSGMVASFSWNGSAVQANEYLVSPQITLPAGLTASLSWWFRVNGSYPADKLAVKVSTTGNSTTNFTATLIDITPTAANGTWTQQTVDLSAYAGQNIYLAFHHHDSYDENYILVDDIQITTSALPTQYTLTVLSNNNAWGTVTGGGTYNAGSTATLTSTPNSGYRFVQWQDGSTSATRTVTVTANATYTATFEAIPPTQYTLTVTSNNNAWGTVTGGGTYNEGTSVTLIATPNNGYHFVQWQDGNTSATRTVTVTANATYTATFEADVNCPPVTSYPYSESFDSEATCWTAIDGNNDNSTWRTIASISGNTDTIIPHSGSGMMASFSWNGSAMQANEYLVSPQFVLPAGQTITLSWWFRVNGSYPADKLAVKVSATGNVVSNFTTTLIDITPTAANGTWTQQTVDLSAYAGQSIYLAFHHHDSYDENYILVDDIQITTSALPTQYTLTVLSNNNAWGTVTGGGTYNAGSTAPLTATPNNGYRFVQWQDGSTSATRNVIVTANATYTATFEAIPPTQYTLTVLSNNDDWGTVSGGGTYDEGSRVELAAAGSSGYHLVNWSDGNADSVRTVTVFANAVYIANFAPNSVGIDGVEISSLALYPNPASDKVSINVTEAGEMSVVDMKGLQLMQQQVAEGSNTVDVGALPSGVYFVKVGAAIRKLVINR